MKVLLSLALVGALLLAGCSGSSTSGTPSSTGTTPSSAAPTTKATGSASTSGGAPTSTSAPAANQAPTILIFTANRTVGAAPLKVQFRLNATDADKDNLSFVLSFGDGTSNATGRLPTADLVHTFTVKGNFTARLVVSDGVASANRTVAIAATAPSAVAPMTGSGQTVHGSWTTGVTGCFAPWDNWAFGTPANGVDVFEFAITPATVGQPFVAAITPTGTALFSGVNFFDGATPAASVGSFDDLSGANRVEATVPVGAVHAIAYTCGQGGALDYVAG